MDEAGADEYIKWSDSYLEEIIASGLVLIRRYTELNQTKQQPFNIISRGTLFANVDYHKVFINSQEMEFPRCEFELLCLPAFSLGRVFTNEQLYCDVWGDDYLMDADNGLNSCLNRIRRKLEKADCTACRIKNCGASVFDKSPPYHYEIPIKYRNLNAIPGIVQVWLFSCRILERLLFSGATSSFLRF